MAEKREHYRGYELCWQEPPLTGAGYEVNIASNDLGLQRKLEQYYGVRGAYAAPPLLLLEGALQHAKDIVDQLLR